jgi:hypothetical protein
LHENRYENSDFSYSMKWKKSLFCRSDFFNGFSFGVGTSQATTNTTSGGIYNFSRERMDDSQRWSKRGNLGDTEHRRESGETGENQEGFFGLCKQLQSGYIFHFNKIHHSSLRKEKYDEKAYEGH